MERICFFMTRLDFEMFFKKRIFMDLFGSDKLCSLRISYLKESLEKSDFSGLQYPESVSELGQFDMGSLKT